MHNHEACPLRVACLSISVDWSLQLAGRVNDEMAEEMGNCDGKFLLSSVESG